MPFTPGQTKQASANSATALTVNLASPTVGDVLVAFFAASTTSASGLTAPPGWTLVTSVTRGSGTAGSLAVFTKPADGTETSLTFNSASTARLALWVSEFNNGIVDSVGSFSTGPGTTNAFSSGTAEATGQDDLFAVGGYVFSADPGASTYSNNYAPVSEQPLLHIVEKTLPLHQAAESTVSFFNQTGGAGVMVVLRAGNALPTYTAPGVVYPPLITQNVSGHVSFGRTWSFGQNLTWGFAKSHYTWNQLATATQSLVKTWNGWSARTWDFFLSHTWGESAGSDGGDSGRAIGTATVGTPTFLATYGPGPIATVVGTGALLDATIQYANSLTGGLVTIAAKATVGPAFITVRKDTYTFEPPTELTVSPVYLDGRDRYFPTTKPAHRLMSYFGARNRGVNVWVLKDGTVTINQPWPVESAERVYYGGHEYQVTESEANALAGAGFPVQGYVASAPMPVAPVTSRGRSLFHSPSVSTSQGAHIVPTIIIGATTPAPVTPPPVVGGTTITNVAITAQRYVGSSVITSPPVVVGTTGGGTPPPPSSLGLWVDRGSNAQTQANQETDPTTKAKFQALADVAQAQWCGKWDMNWDTPRRAFAECANVSSNTNENKGRTPSFIVYGIPGLDSGGASSGAAFPDNTSYLNWIDVGTATLGNASCILVIEPDILPLWWPQRTSQPSKWADMTATWNEVFRRFRTRCPNVRIYTDVGHPAWINPPSQVAQMLSDAGLNLSYVDGLSFNVSNFRPDSINGTDSEGFMGVQQYASAVLGAVGISRLNYVYDCSRNGNPSPPPSWQYANPPNIWLGRLPKYGNTGVSRCDGWLYLKRPGESDAPVNGWPAAGEWYRNGALQIINDSIAGGSFSVTTNNWPVPAGYTEVARYEPSQGLGPLGLYGDYASTEGAGYWKQSNVRIATVNGTQEVQLVASVANSRFEGGAFSWNGTNNAAEKFGGRWEFDMAYDYGGNAHAGVALLWPSSDNNWPTNGEIDVIEFGGGSRNPAESNYHLDTTVDSGRALSTSLGNHDFTQRRACAVEWFPNNYIATFIDGQQVARTTDTSYIPHTLPMHLVFQQDWIGQNWQTADHRGPVIMHIYRMRYLAKTS